MPVGDVLRRTREHYGLRLEDVENALHIRAVHLAALENGHPEKLPGRVYAIGFVRAYAEFLGLDGDRIVHMFKGQLVGYKPRPELNFPVSASESKLPNTFILLGAFAGLLALGVFFALSGRTPPAGQDIPAVPVAQKNLQAEKAAQVKQAEQAKQKERVVFGPPAPQIAAASVEPAAGKAQAAAVANRVVINVTDNAWVEIRNAEGQAILSRVLRQGDSYMVPDEAGFVMDTGNIGALDFVIDGVFVGKLGETGDVRRGVSLAPDQLKIVPAAADGTPPKTVE